eukprot:TRINITY_DN1002_c1_g1_i3.p1 TRINITY_DN1002_c1_g1~~TRINITY_DN1002_c1_g1_i3.p1  ORF type:complete len:268 (+),score=-22.12 TRINITY_DN1002_c1_g1_i3:109-804(+)
MQKLFGYSTSYLKPKTKRKIYLMQFTQYRLQTNKNGITQITQYFLDNHQTVTKNPQSHKLELTSKTSPQSFSSYILQVISMPWKCLTFLKQQRDCKTYPFLYFQSKNLSQTPQYICRALYMLACQAFTITIVAKKEATKYIQILKNICNSSPFVIIIDAYIRTFLKLKNQHRKTLQIYLHNFGYILKCILNLASQKLPIFLLTLAVAKKQILEFKNIHNTKIFPFYYCNIY